VAHLNTLSKTVLVRPTCSALARDQGGHHPNKHSSKPVSEYAPSARRGAVRYGGRNRLVFSHWRQHRHRQPAIPRALGPKHRPAVGGVLDRELRRSAHRRAPRIAIPVTRDERHSRINTPGQQHTGSVNKRVGELLTTVPSTTASNIRPRLPARQQPSCQRTGGQ
jgi:hypothetical protein